MTNLSALAALAGLAFLASCSGPEAPLDQDGTLRLVEHLESAEVRRAEALEGSLPPPEGDAELAQGPPAAPGMLRRVALGKSGESDLRVALTLPPGARLRLPVTLPVGGELRLGLGGHAANGDEAAARGEVSFRITVESPAGSEPVVVLDRRLEVAPERRWVEERVDLDRWSGKPVHLELSGGTSTAGGPWPAFAAPVNTAPRQAPRWNLVLISLDTLRADRLGCYGYERRPTSPEMDAFAGRGLRFDQAIAQSPWTRPSHRSFLTGLYPSSRAGLSSPAIAQMLWKAGYRTVALTGGGQVDSDFGFHRGFSIFRVTDWIYEPEAAIDWLDQIQAEPFFLFLHTYEIHEPYSHGELAAGLPSGRYQGSFSKARWNQVGHDTTEIEKTWVEALYDGDLAFTDSRLGRLFARL